MTESFDSFNAPQFFDFSQDLYKEENVDSYFEIDHENIKHEDPLEDPLKFIPSEDLQNGNESVFFSPLQTPVSEKNREENPKNQPRRSMSVGDLKLPCNTEYKSVKKIEKLEAKKYAPKYSSSNNLKKSESNTSLCKAGPTRTSAPRLMRAASKENLDRLAQPKRYGSAQNLNQICYVSMAEAVRKFQNGTPTRFKTRPKSVTSIINKPGTTIPHSPALMTKSRHRPVQAVSREEQEIMEYEEAQKFKIKAKPLNRKVLQGPIKPMVPLEKKPSTVVEPFKITEPKKVVESPKKEVFEFHAKPIPKCLYELPKLKDVQKMCSTVPQTPTFMKRYVKEPVKTQICEEKPKPTVKHARTTPVPFSFEKRDQACQNKMEQMIKKVLEEEKKAREFHARPAPKAILSSHRSNSICQNLDIVRDHRNHSKSEENLSTQFKAKPATVLYKKPFEPIKERQYIEILEFQLNTERRAKEREEFEQHKREKEEKIALAKQLEEQLRLQKEDEEAVRLRKETEYKAKPIKKYKEIVIQYSGKVTEPISPKFHTGKLRGKDNKENLC